MEKQLNIMVFNFNPSRFKLNYTKEYRDTDSYIDELSRKINFSEEIAIDYIGEYLNEQIEIYLSWSLLILIPSLIFIPIVLNTNIYIGIIPIVLFIISTIFFLKAKSRIKNFNFNKGMLLSMAEMYKNVTDEE